MEGILEADIMFKSSKLGYSSPQTILENLLLTICTSEKDKTLKRATERR